MTPMVDLGFLLITFFIFTSAMTEPIAMDLFMPTDKGDPTPIKRSGALTIIPNGPGSWYYYEGELETANIKRVSGKEVRRIIIDKKGRTPERDFFVVIKPTNVANYRQVVDLLDEMTINMVNRFALVKISKEENDLISLSP